MRGRAFATSASVLALLGLGAACAKQGAREASVVCTLEARSSFAVTAVDSMSGAPIRGATVRVTEGAFSDTLVAQPSGTNPYSGVVYERGGTYAVSVSHPDYRPWQRAAVTVTRDQCHVQTQQLTARLQRRAG
jgi:hypothetical protein